MVQIDIPSSYQTIKTKLESIVARRHYTKTQSDNKYIVDMELVPKSSDSTGAIRLKYGND